MLFIIPVVASLKRILEENWTSIEKYKSEHSHDEGKYRDICCGELYRQQNGCDDPTKLLSFLFHIDGAPAVKSKTHSLWPIQCILVELPVSIRYSFKNVLFCGLWCGVRKPDLQLFQKYFVDQVQAINECGLTVDVRATNKRVKVTVLNLHGHLVDLVAKALSLNFRQFNGHLNKMSLVINFPHNFNQKLRPFHDFKRLKGREIQNFFLHASLSQLKTLISPEFFYHLSIFVTAIWLLIDGPISSEVIELARILLVHYGRLVEPLHGKSEQTYTVHALQHLPEQVKNFGPLILHSGFVFEAMISHLKRLLHGMRCIPDQIVKNLIIAQNTNTFIENSTSSGGNEELCKCNFARNLAEHNKSSTSQQYDGISLIGEVKSTNFCPRGLTATFRQ